MNKRDSTLTAAAVGYALYEARAGIALPTLPRTVGDGGPKFVSGATALSHYFAGVTHDVRVVRLGTHGFQPRA